MPAARPTPAFIARALAGVKRAGHAPMGIEIRPDGTVFVALHPAAAPTIPITTNTKDDDECDRLFGMA